MKGTEKERNFQVLRNQMGETPWIHLRNKLICALINKRRELGLSQIDMANAMGAKNSNVARFESMALVTKKGQPVTPHNPTLKFIGSYAAALGVDIDFVLTSSGTGRTFGDFE